MDVKIKEALERELISELNKLNTLDPSTDEYNKVVNNLEKLYKLHIEESKSNKDDFFKWLKLGVEITGIILPLSVYAVFLGRGFRFEETGSYCSKTFSNLIGLIRPSK